MKFQTLKDEVTHHETALRKLRDAQERSWVLPDRLGMLDVIVKLEAPDGPPQIAIELARWIPEPDASVTVTNGPTIKGGYFEHDYNTLRFANRDVLAYVIAARTYCEKWIAGEIDALPLQAFV